MTPSIIVDLLLTIILTFHALWAWIWVRRRLSALLSILAHPFRNELVYSALPAFAIIVTVGLTLYIAILWRFAMLLDALGASGGGVVVLIILFGLFSIAGLAAYCLCLTLMMVAAIDGVGPVVREDG